MQQLMNCTDKRQTLLHKRNLFNFEKTYHALHRVKKSINN